MIKRRSPRLVPAPKIKIESIKVPETKIKTINQAHLPQKTKKRIEIRIEKIEIRTRKEIKIKKDPKIKIRDIVQVAVRKISTGIETRTDIIRQAVQKIKTGRIRREKKGRRVSQVTDFFHPLQVISQTDTV